ncbi:beta-amyrin 24-hydroxylase-like [Cryptomeria japonica]|uniref:beta-amyrin 24-hydroxylase-like n=1 Tax=Cryptomeria japonica TaxID=3369 RepID=UPI0027DAACAD|nr:beta-amyrin 24-hydroxylase-like [Cryptomeria japonica]
MAANLEVPAFKTIQGDDEQIFYVAQRRPFFYRQGMALENMKRHSHDDEEDSHDNDDGNRLRHSSFSEAQEDMFAVKHGLIEEDFVEFKTEDKETRNLLTQTQIFYSNLENPITLLQELLDPNSWSNGSTTTFNTIHEDKEDKEEDVSKMVYVEAVVKETLHRRLPGHFILGHAVIEETTIGGYDVPMNALMNFIAWEVDNDPQVW